MINSKIWHNNQHGFIPGRTIQDVTQKLATTIDAIRRHTSSNHAVILIDFRKAFDNINCLYLLLTLTKLNIDDDTILYGSHGGPFRTNSTQQPAFESVQIGKGSTSGEPSIACTFQHRIGTSFP